MAYAGSETDRNAKIRADLPAAPFAESGGPGMTENAAYRLIREELVQMATAMRRHVKYIGKLNLWQVERADGRTWAASLAKRSHHPLTRIAIELALQHQDVHDLAKQARKEGDIEVGIKAEAQRSKILAEIRSTVTDSMKIANDTIKNCESALAKVAQMAMQVQMHREKLESVGSDQSDRDLMRLASKAAPKKLEAFLELPRE